MHRAAAKLFFFLAALLLLALGASASLTPPPPPDLKVLAFESFTDAPQQLTWQDLEAPETCPLAPVLAVLILPVNTPYDDAGVVILVPCDPKNRLYRVFRDRQPPLGLYWGESVVNGIWGTIKTTGKVLRECPDAAKNAMAAVVKEAATSSANLYYTVTGSSEVCDESVALRYFDEHARLGVSAGDSAMCAWKDISEAIPKIPYQIGERISDASYLFAQSGDDTELVQAQADLVGPVLAFYAFSGPIRPTAGPRTSSCRIKGENFAKSTGSTTRTLANPSKGKLFRVIRAKLKHSQLFRTMRERVIQFRQQEVARLAQESGHTGPAVYLHESGSSQYLHVDGNWQPGTVVIRQHAFYEPGGVKSVFYHELGHWVLPHGAFESQVDAAAASLAEEIYGHSDDIILPFVDQ